MWVAPARYNYSVLTTRWIATVLFLVAVPLFFVLTNVRVAASEPLVYDYAYSQHDGVTRTGIDREQLDIATDEIVDYFRNGTDDQLLDTRVVVDGEMRALFSQREILHMRDVKNLFQIAFRAHEIAFVYIVVYTVMVVLWSRERTLRDLAQQLIIAGCATVAILGIAAIGLLVGFESAFEQFHLLSFDNDFWRLNPETSHLVQMFPLEFWFEVTLAVGVLTVIQGSLVAIGGYGYLVWDDYRQAR